MQAGETCFGTGRIFDVEYPAWASIENDGTEQSLDMDMVASSMSFIC